MKNEIEVIDGVKGEWRTVTKRGQIKFGQRVRYSWHDERHGFRDSRIKGDRVLYYLGAPFFGNGWTVQAFFPLRAKRKVAKVTITDFIGMSAMTVRFRKYTVQDSYKSRKSAIRGARRFCKTIGYECEVVK